jgi:hypothetical protein
MTGDVWFWIASVFFSGWCFWLFYYLPRNYCRIPPTLRDRAAHVLNRPISIKGSSTPIVYADLSELCGVALYEWLETLAEMEGVRRGVPPSVFSARRRGLDS